jgi:hypothetical protein
VIVEPSIELDKCEESHYSRNLTYHYKTYQKKTLLKYDGIILVYLNKAVEK